MLIAVASLAGCGSDEMPTVPVTGRVTLDGQPLTAGTVYFVPTAGPAASGALQADGSYQLSTRGDGDGAVAGAHQIYFGSPASDLGDYSFEDYVADVAPPEPTNASVIPAKYRSMATSRLSATVKNDSQPIDLELTSE